MKKILTLGLLLFVSLTFSQSTLENEKSNQKHKTEPVKKAETLCYVDGRWVAKSSKTEQLQKKLKRKDYDIEVNGFDDDKTKAAKLKYKNDKILAKKERKVKK